LFGEIGSLTRADANRMTLTLAHERRSAYVNAIQLRPLFFSKGRDDNDRRDGAINMTFTQWASGITAFLAVVSFSLSTLGQSPDTDKALAPLIHQLGDADDDIRMAAVKQIHKMGPKIIPQVLDRMNNPDLHTRYGVALVVRQFGADSVPYLTSLATGSDTQKQLQAIELL
jgi:hypothetical protein